MASAALPHSAGPPQSSGVPHTPESLQSRMDQFFNLTSGGLTNVSKSSSFCNSYANDPYGPNYTSGTSGSNSGDEEEEEEEEERELFGHENQRHDYSLGPSVNKRRKQSKPSRCESNNNSSCRVTETEEEPISESPLNLSAGSATKEPLEKTPSLRVLGHELYTSSSLKSEELKVSKVSELAGAPGSVYQNVSRLPFPLNSFPFPFPSTLKSVSGLRIPGNPSALSSSSSPGARSSIFNPEAYCELCNKEFCNKYFLKTHKANKHGIYSEFSTGRSPCNDPSSISGAFLASNLGALRPPFLPLSPLPSSQVSPISSTSNIPLPISSKEPRRISETFDSSTESKKDNEELRIQDSANSNFESQHFRGKETKNPHFDKEKSPFLHGKGNREAFCEMCSKEFCNKYFLRVHKLKKHGICSPDLPPEKVTKILNQMTKEAGLLPSSSQCLSNELLSVKSPLRNKISNLESITGSLDSKHNMEKTHLGELNAEAFEIKKNNHNNHNNNNNNKERHENEENSSVSSRNSSNCSNEPDGIEQGEIVSHFTGRNSSSAREDLLRLQSMILELNQRNSLGSLSSESPLSIGSRDLKRGVPLGTRISAEDFCNERNESFNKSSIRPGNSAQNDIETPFENDFKNKETISSEPSSQFLGSLSVNSMISGEDERSYLERIKNELAFGAMSPNRKDPNRRPASLSRSYCEICKKELCNKYFMKTHMLKMHGINIEATNATGVCCSICKKELCSKYFLKVHLQNSHGVLSSGNEETSLKDGLPSPSSSSSCLFPSLFSSSLENEVISSGLGSRETLGTSSGTDSLSQSCSLCGETFRELVNLQIHIIKSHGALLPESSYEEEPEEGEVKRRDSTHENHENHENSENHENPENSENSENQYSRASLENGESIEENDDNNSFQKHSLHLQLEALHRQFFPGLMTPFLSRFSNSLPFPLHKLLASSASRLTSQYSTPLLSSSQKDFAFNSTPEPSASSQLLNSHSSLCSNSSSSLKKTIRRYKCSKCSLKFKRRELCLQHIVKVHKALRTIRRKLHFSPHKPLRGKNRSEYVRQFMALLKVPTSRGTPSGKTIGKHIMQPFLLKSPPSNNQDKDNSSSSSSSSFNNDKNFVPSLVYLPVSKRVSGPLTVAFNLIPA